MPERRLLQNRAGAMRSSGSFLLPKKTAKTNRLCDSIGSVRCHCWRPTDDSDTPRSNREINVAGLLGLCKTRRQRLSGSQRGRFTVSATKEDSKWSLPGMMAMKRHVSATIGTIAATNAKSRINSCKAMPQGGACRPGGAMALPHGNRRFDERKS